MNTTVLRRDYYALINGRLSAPMGSYATAKRTGLPTTSRTKRECYTVWPPVAPSAATPRRATLRDYVARALWVATCALLP